MWFLLFLIPTVFSTTCPDCPIYGIWSDWVNNGSCATSCGSCSLINRTRTCLSDDIDCPCTGKPESKEYCETEACNFSRSNTNVKNCCSGSLVVHKNWYHCGPIPADYHLNCCPDGGYWSTWSTYVRVEDQIAWRRNRTCLSINHQCPCSGDDFQLVTECPCAHINSIPVADTSCSSVISGWRQSTGVVARSQVRMRPSMCRAFTTIELSGYLGTFIVDSKATLGMIKSDGTCVKYEHPVTAGPPNSLGRIEYYCNLTTLEYEVNPEVGGFVSVAQFYRT